MAVSVVAEAKRYLYRYGCNTDTTVDPVDLIRDLVEEYDRLHQTLVKVLKKKPKAVEAVAK